jgi:lauroyl/myristoyl acyltransferase
LWFCFSVRRSERRLSVQNLYRLLWLHTFVRAALRGFPAAVPVPAGLGAGQSIRIVRERRMKRYWNQVLEYLPDRLAQPKWLDRCRLEGLDPVLRARQNGRPVVLAFAHFSAYRLSRFWLRAAGIPAATLMAGRAESRTAWERLGDGSSPFPEMPTAFYLDQLREAGGFLAAGNLLLVALDHAAGKQMKVPAGEGWTFQMATGAVRLAVRHRAELIPCVVIDEGHWRFQVKLGRPVPAEYLTAEADWIHAGKHLLHEMLPHFRNHPDQCLDFINNFQRSPPADGKSSG